MPLHIPLSGGPVILLFLFFGLAAVMWLRMGMFDHSRIIARQHHEHERVHKVLKKHPKGGSWSQYVAWLRREK